VDVFVTTANEFAPQLNTVSGLNSGFITEDAEIGDLVRVSNVFNNQDFLQLIITDQDYVRLYTWCGLELNYIAFK